MRQPLRSLLAVTVASLAATAVGTHPSNARADEGMWPFNMVPRAEIKRDHHVDITDEWLDKVRLASVRFNSGGSGSFVSSSGLVLTNHHVGADCVAKISSAGHDYLDAGYLAGKDGPEVRCPDLELNQLVSIEDVTDQVRAARKDGMSDADANVAMKGAMAHVEKACAEKTKSRCDVVTLYAGGAYHLYTYKKFTDVRLVFAPEKDIAFFGGDPDNFTFPRYDLDLAIFRIYDNGQAVKPKSFLKWNPEGPKDGETVFVSGHPGSTGRMHTLTQLERTRDTLYPITLDGLEKYRGALLAYGKTSKEATRQVRETIFGVENSLKAIRGYQSGLKDARLMKKKADDEAALRKAIDADAKLKAAYGTVFDDVAKIQKVVAELYPRYAALEMGPRSSLYRNAMALVRLADERQLPNDKRLPEYRDSGMDSLKLRLFSPAPVYGGVEVAALTTWLERLAKQPGSADPVVARVLAGRTPRRAAEELVAGTRLSDVYARRHLFDGGKAAVDASTDPMIALARLVDPDARAVRHEYEDKVEAPSRLGGEHIAQAVFAVRGATVAPDATFTLRLSTGVVRGYEEAGKNVPWTTDFAGLYAHATGKDPDKLPARWVERKAALDPKTSFNIVSTDDIIGGNSGSPLINAGGELVGLIFDGNLSSLPNRFVYGEATERAVSVNTAAMTEALTKIYDAQALVKELTAP